MADNPKVPLAAGESFARAIGVRQLARALRDDAYQRAAASVTVEAQRALSPWEDVLEQWDDGHLHVWQVKSGADVTKEELAKLIEKLSDLPHAHATLATRTNLHVRGLQSGLHEFDRVLHAVRKGGAPNFDDISPWAAFLCETCGGPEGAENVAQRVHIEFLGSFESPATQARALLDGVYQEHALAAVLDRIRSIVEDTIGSALSVPALRRGGLAEFERHRTRTLPRDVSLIRREYLDSVQAAVKQRRALRDISQDGVRLIDVWTPLPITDDTGERFDSDEFANRIRHGELHVLLAPAGSGKTEVLARLASELATAAENSDQASLPVLLRGSRVGSLTDEAIFDSVNSILLGTGRPFLELLHAPGVQWVLLIDEVDEIQHGAEVVDALRRRFLLPTTVAAARPSIGRSLEPANSFRIERWSAIESERFLNAMARSHQNRSETLRALGPHATALMHRPLTATLTVLATIDLGAAPSNTTLLFGSAIQALVELWATRRKIKNPWDSVADEIRRLALEYVRGKLRNISRREVERLAARVAPDRALALRDAAEIDFGILVATDDGYEFLVRGLAEYLAAVALFRDDAATLDAAKRDWGAEVARHALVLVADSDLERFLRLMRVILTEFQGSPASLGALRSLLVALHVVADVGDPASPLAQELADACCLALTSEYSPWRADRAAEALAKLAQGGGLCWDELERRLVAILSDPREPESYYRTLKDDRAETWLHLLMHCDPGVRREATRRLRHFTNEPRIVRNLFLMLQDTAAFPFWGVPPAIEAGEALRRADRAGPIANHLQAIRSLSEVPGQVAPAAGAVALLPGEQDASILVRAFRGGADGQFLPTHVVQELANYSQDGTMALDAAWPEWRTYRRLEHPYIEIPSWQVECDRPAPPSRWTRRRIVRAARDAITRSAALDEVLSRALGNDARDLFLEALCEGALLRPADLSAGLLTVPAADFPLLSDPALDSLAKVVVRRPEIGAQLIERWSDFEALHPSGRLRFPGRALEPMVVAGIDNAVCAYAAWLPYSRHANGLDGAAPNPQVFEQQPVREVAKRLVDEVWAFAIHGRVDAGGNRTWLYSGTAAAVLRQLAPSWHVDNRLVQEIAVWLEDADPNKRLAAVTALLRAPLSDAEREAVKLALRESLSARSDIEKFFNMPTALGLTTSHGLVAALLAEITALVEERGPTTILAACAALPYVPAAEAERLSQLASARQVDAFDFEGIDHKLLSRLVELAPEHWLAAILRHAEQRGAINLGLSIPIFDALPLARKRDAAMKLRSVSRQHVLPWCAHHTNGDIYRPIDLVERLLFDSGENE